MTARPIRRNAQTPDRNGKIFYTSTTSLSHISKELSLLIWEMALFLRVRRLSLYGNTSILMHLVQIYDNGILCKKQVFPIDPVCLFDISGQYILDNLYMLGQGIVKTLPAF